MNENNISLLIKSFKQNSKCFLPFLFYAFETKDNAIIKMDFDEYDSIISFIAVKDNGLLYISKNADKQMFNEISKEFDSKKIEMLDENQLSAMFFSTKHI